jgi:hypothetical protein
LTALKELQVWQAERIQECLLALTFEHPQDQGEEVLADRARTETPPIGIGSAIMA